MLDGDYAHLGRMMQVSHDGDRLPGQEITDELLKKLIAENAPLDQQCGAYRCSTEQIDGLCDLLNSTEGVLGSAIIGAGLGGCVVALARKDCAEHIISTVNREYYDRNGFAHSAIAYTPSSGSSVIY